LPRHVRARHPRLALLAPARAGPARGEPAAGRRRARELLPDGSGRRVPRLAARDVRLRPRALPRDRPLRKLPPARPQRPRARRAMTSRSPAPPRPARWTVAAVALALGVATA